MDRLPDPYTCSAAVLLVRAPGGAYLAVRGPRGLGFPGGKRLPHESPIACAVREAREECGIALDADVARFIGERKTAAGHLVALVWHPPLEPDAALGPETREGLPLWAEPADLTAPTARHPDWNAWALKTARTFERDPAPFDVERSPWPDTAALLAAAADAAAKAAVRAKTPAAPSGEAGAAPDPSPADDG